MILKPIFSLIMEVTYATSVSLSATNNKSRVIEDFEHLKEYQKDANRAWTYVNDKWLGIRNNISPPPIAVTQSSGDCDDFASHMYQVSQNFNPLLLTYFPKNIFNAHTVTVLKPTTGEYEGFYVLMNWSRFKVFATKQEVIMNLEGYANSKMLSYHWAEYDYPSGRYRNVKDKEV
jgi:hypothetical protein